MSKQDSLCFVCTGNTCRSPMAQFILKSKIAEENAINIRVTSFGTHVTEEKINPMAKLALKNNGIKMTKFIPKQITLEKVRGFGAIVAMTDSIKQFLEKEGYENVYSVNQLTKYGDICDPYGKTQYDYDLCCSELERACSIIYEMLKKVL